MRYRGKAVLLAAVGVCVMAAAPAFGYSLSEAQALERNKDWNGVLRYAQAWTTAAPNNADAWAVLSVAYFFGFNRPDLALDPAKRSAALAPRDPGAWTALGILLQETQSVFGRGRCVSPCR